MEDFLSRMMGDSTQDTGTAISDSLNEIIFYGLGSSGFFVDASLCGDAALRLFHGLDRRTKGLDFVLKGNAEDMDLSAYVEPLQNLFDGLGITVEIGIGISRGTMDITYHGEDAVRIPIMTYAVPGVETDFERRMLYSPFPCEVSVLRVGSLYADKIYGIICGSQLSDSLGCNLYDLVFCVSRNMVLDMDYLGNRLIQAGIMDEESVPNLDDVKDMLMEMMDDIDFEAAKADVIPFIRNEGVLSIWSREFFSDVVSRII